MKKQFIVALLAATAAFASNAALADTVVINQTFDLDFPDANTGTHFNLNSDNFASTLIHVGDTVELNYNFMPNQALRVSTTGGAQTFSLGLWQDQNATVPSVFTVGNVSFNLVGAGGGSFPAVINGAGTQIGGSSHIGSSLTGSFLPSNGSITFTGMHASFTVAALQGGQNSYNSAFFTVNGNSVVTTTPVPEPETYAMMIAGLGLLALARRKAKQA